MNILDAVHDGNVFSTAFKNRSTWESCCLVRLTHERAAVSHIQRMHSAERPTNRTGQGDVADLR